ncbi:recombinase family protein [Listeria booriae]|uniref:recombinase family protein n=1 Tax=Listeria booriae TaxID=1552123 RepID=UPI0016273912|nr:recombinase family protein [Listeria booriae]MBC2069327.1 recombinase family protein [Listeria booriae]
MIYGYARVSTIGQDYETQVELLKAAGCEKIFHEKVTGSKIARKELDSLFSKLQDGDTFVVTRLDRFARSTVEGLTTTKKLFDQGIKVHILNLGLIENTPTGRLILANFFAFAEFERDMILERTAEGKKRARLNPDFKEGRPKKFTKAQIDFALSLLKENSYTDVSKKTGISKSTLIRANKTRNVREE